VKGRSEGRKRIESKKGGRKEMNKGNGKGKKREGRKIGGRKTGME
jgi:hypothetical protein